MLNPADSESQQHTYGSADYADEPAFHYKYSLYQRLSCSEAAQCLHVFLLVNDEHRKRTDDVEARHNEYECEKDICHEFLYLHYIKGVLLLLIAVHHLVFLSRQHLHLLLHLVHVSPLFQLHLKGCYLAVTLEEHPCKWQTGEYVVAVIFTLLNTEHHAG